MVHWVITKKAAKVKKTENSSRISCFVTKCKIVRSSIHFLPFIHNKLNIQLNIEWNQKQQQKNGKISIFRLNIAFFFSYGVFFSRENRPVVLTCLLILKFFAFDMSLTFLTQHMTLFLLFLFFHSFITFGMKSFIKL